jgi:aromatic ring-opening dioxygenase catalytic subunit (LigB family)
MIAMPEFRRVPALFVAHASPMLALERAGHAEALRRFGGGLRGPSAVAVAAFVPAEEQ